MYVLSSRIKDMGGPGPIFVGGSFALTVTSLNQNFNKYFWRSRGEVLKKKF